MKNRELRKKKQIIFRFKKLRGFTMIELLIIVSVVGLLSSMGAGLYRDYGETKRVSTAGEDVASLLNVAKTRAMSQIKPAVCGGAELDGYRVVTCSGGCSGGVYTYQLEAFCGGSGYRVGNIYKLPTNVSFGSTLQQSVLFRTLTGAAQATSDITVSSGSKTMTISTSKAGLIAMSGLESSVAVSGAPTLTFNASTTSVGWGGSVTLTWTSTGATSCTASNGWAGTKTPNNTTGEVISPLTATTTFTLDCTGPGGTTASQNKTITVSSPTSPVIASFTAEDPVLPTTNTGTALHWTTTGSITGCTASAGTGSWTGAQSYPSGDFDTGSLAVTTTYTLTCTGPLGSDVESVVVTVTAAASTPTPTPKMVLVNATSNSGAEVNATSVTWQHTVSGTERALFVGVVTELSRTVTVTWMGSQTLTSIQSLGTSGNQYAYLYYLVNPTAGTGNIVVTINSSDNIKAGAVSLTNVNQTTPIGTPQGKTVSSSVSITSNALSSSIYEKIVDVIAISSSAVGVTAAIPQQQIWSTVGGSTNPSGAGSYRDGGSSVTTSWSWSSSKGASLIAVPVKVAP